MASGEIPGLSLLHVPLAYCPPLEPFKPAIIYTLEGKEPFSEKITPRTDQARPSGKGSALVDITALLQAIIGAFALLRWFHGLGKDYDQFQDQHDQAG
jgi:hypothetical protein